MSTWLRPEDRLYTPAEVAALLRVCLSAQAAIERKHAAADAAMRDAVQAATESRRISYHGGAATATPPSPNGSRSASGPSTRPPGRPRPARSPRSTAAGTTRTSPNWTGR